MSVIVKANQGGWDSVTAAGRLLIVIGSTAPAAALLVKKHDLIGLYDYFQSQPGVALLAAVSGLVSLVFGIYKSWKRGREMANVASDPAVPDTVASIKDGQNA